MWSGGVLSSLNVLRNHHIYFFTDCTELHSDTMCRISLLPHSYQHAVFLIFAILIGVRQNLSVVLTCILFGQGCWTFFIYLLAICGPSGNLLFPLFTHLLIGLFFSVIFFNFIIYSSYQSLAVCIAGKGFLSPVGCTFTFICFIHCA